MSSQRVQGHGVAVAMPSTVDLVASTVTLFAVAVALPILDLLGRNPEFFVAHRVSSGEIVVATLLFVVVVPLVLGGIAAAVTAVNRRVGIAVHGVLVVGLVGLVAVVGLKRTPLATLPWWAHLGLAMAAGGLALVAFHRWGNARWVLRIGLVLPLLLIVTFLFMSRTSALVNPVGSVASDRPVSFASAVPPIVVLILDELPLTSIVDGEGRIQAEAYPNLARLGTVSTWYRDATTVSSRTTLAVPAILTGTAPPLDAVPTLADHPANLFTWAAHAYDLRIVEPVTLLCPVESCARSRRWGAVLSDLSVVAGHVLLPEDVSEDLPPIDGNWSGFAADAALSSDVEVTDSEPGGEFDMPAEFRAALDEDRRTHVQDFLDRISPSGDKPTLYFAHFLVPHRPWLFLPDGQVYIPHGIRSGADDSSSDALWRTNQAYQRHLAQAQYADHIIGEVIDRLEEVGAFDEALVVVVADHGIAIRPGLESRREATPDTVADVLAVPLMIKAPFQDVGVVDDYPALVTDVLPTIADMVGTELPWDVSGVSLIGADRPVRTTRTFRTGTGLLLAYGSPLGEVIDLGARRIGDFGRSGAFGLAPPGHSDLLGRTLASFDASAPAPSASLSNADSYETVDADADGLPAVVIGRLSGWAAEQEGAVVAVALNGIVSAVTVPRPTAGGDSAAFIAMLNPAHFVDGANQVDLMLVTGVGAQRQFRPLEMSTGGG